MKRLTLALSALLASGAAFAQSDEVTLPITEGTVTVKSVQPPIGNASDYQVKVADIDKNGDGVVSKSEVPTDHALYFEFKLVDTDRNGRVTDEELANWK